MKKNLFFVLLLCSVLQGTSQTPAEFKTPANRYRPKPLWFWNNTTVTRKGIDTQLKALKEQAYRFYRSVPNSGQNTSLRNISTCTNTLREKPRPSECNFHYTTNTDSRAAAVAR